MSDRTEVPRLLVRTDREQARRSLRVTVLEVAAAGAPAVVLGEEDLDVERRRRLGTQLAAVTGGLGTALLVAGDPALAVDVGSGVLLDPDDESVTGELRAQLLVGRSCPDEHAVTAAVAEQVDLVVVGPDRLGELVAAAGDLPVLVRGEPAADELATWLEAGAHGVVVGASVMRAKAPAEVVADLLERLGGHSG